jgi:hypothetical protein
MGKCRGLLRRACIAFELALYHALRSKTFHIKKFAALLAIFTFCAALLPLFVAGTSSYSAARDICYDRTYTRYNATFTDKDSPAYDPEWNFDDVATRHLFPQHLFNTIATVVSLCTPPPHHPIAPPPPTPHLHSVPPLTSSHHSAVGFWLWLFASHHVNTNQSKQAQDLDRTCTTSTCIVLCPRTLAKTLACLRL